MDKNIDWAKILRYLNNECSVEEELELNEWMFSDSENEKFIQFLELIWQMEPIKKKNIDPDLAWEKFNVNFPFDDNSHSVPGEEKPVPVLKVLQTSNRKKNGAIYWFSFASIAASLLIAFVLSYQFSHFSLSSPAEYALADIEYRELRTEKGQRTRIILTDGSVIHLNGDSYLKIPEVFRAGQERMVYLEGEAFFEITRDDNITFQVVADQTVTTVLGTRFNVRSYKEDSDVTVVVADGTVSFGYLNESAIEPAILTQYQKGIIRMGRIPVITDVTDLSVYHGWTVGELVFDQEPLPQIISKLERWFGIEIEMRDAEWRLEDKELTASFSERQPVEDVLQSISLVLGLSIQRTNTSSHTYTLINNQ